MLIMSEVSLNDLSLNLSNAANVDTHSLSIWKIESLQLLVDFPVSYSLASQTFH